MKTAKQFRHSLGLSVNQCADMLGVNERTLRRWEYGEIPTPKAVLMVYDIAERDMQSVIIAEQNQRLNDGRPQG